MLVCVVSCFFFSCRRRHTRCALVTVVQTCALPISHCPVDRVDQVVVHLETPLRVTRVDEILAEAGRAAEIGRKHRVSAIGEQLVERIEAIVIARPWRSEEHTSELQSLMRISYAVFCLKKKIHNQNIHYNM